MTNNDYYHKNKDKLKAAHRKYYLQHKVEILKKHKRYEHQVLLGMRRKRNRMLVGNHYITTSN